LGESSDLQRGKKPSDRDLLPTKLGIYSRQNWDIIIKKKHWLKGTPAGKKETMALSLSNMWFPVKILYNMFFFNIQSIQ